MFGMDVNQISRTMVRTGPGSKGRANETDSVVNYMTAEDAPGAGTWIHASRSGASLPHT